MAVNSTPVASDLVLVMDNGTGANGQQLQKKRQYTDVKTSATDEDVFAVAQDLLSLQQTTCLAIQRMNTLELSEA